MYGCRSPLSPLLRQVLATPMKKDTKKEVDRRKHLAHLAHLVRGGAAAAGQRPRKFSDEALRE